MEKFSEIYSRYKDYILCALLFIVFLLISILIFYHFESSIINLKKEFKKEQTHSVKKENQSEERLIVDIKGAVKKPGVYYLEKDKRVIDVVNKAGGFTNNADSSANNLSMKIKDEMVIIIYSKDEIKDYLNTKEREKQKEEKCATDKIANDSCITTVNGEKQETQSSNKTSKTTSNNSKTQKMNSSSSNDIESNGMVSLNTATKEELMTLSGVGESKADAIIEYRNQKKFETIEEIKEVSGIGDALFEKIKDRITT